MKINTKIILIILFFLTALITIEAQDNSFSDIFEFKNCVAPYKSFKKLLNNPVEVEAHIDQKREDGDKILDTLLDFHAIFDIPIDKLSINLIDLDNEHNVFPRMIYSKDLNPYDPLWSPHLQEIKTQFKMGRIEETYHYIFNRIPEIKDDGSILIKWNLYESIDGKFEYIYGSWYLKEIFYENKTYTYVRNYIHYGMKNYPPYVLIGMKLGGRKDSKNFLKALQEASK